MRLLLDTHALLWLLTGDRKLTEAAKTAVTVKADTTYVSAASAWEVATKHRLGKLAGADRLADNFQAVTADANLASLSVTIQHAQRAGQMVGGHKDPFDRMLIAQALIEDLTLVSNEARFDAFGVRRLW